MDYCKTYEQCTKLKKNFSVFSEPLAELDPILEYSSFFKLRATPSCKREIIYTFYIIYCVLFIVYTFHLYSDITSPGVLRTYLNPDPYET